MYSLEGCWEGWGWGEQGSPGKSEHCIGPRGCGGKLVVFRSPRGQALGQKGGLEPGQKGILSSLEPDSLLHSFLSAYPLSKGTG